MTAMTSKQHFWAFLVPWVGGSLSHHFHWNTVGGVIGVLVIAFGCSALFEFITTPKKEN
jgi:RsiW-degrading membrane proteinase PrsW (M82 family)